MISRDLRVEALDGLQLRRLLELLDPPPSTNASRQGSGRGRGERSGWLGRVAGIAQREPTDEALPPRMARSALVLLRRGRVERIVLLGAGPLSSSPNGGEQRPAVTTTRWRAIGGTSQLPPGELDEVSPAGLSRLRAREGLAFVVAVHSEAVPRLVAELSTQLTPDDDPMAMGLMAARTMQRALGRDVLLSPRLLGSLPLPRYELLSKTFNRLFPDGRTMMFYVLDEGRVWTSVIWRKRGGHVDLVTSQAALDEQLRVRNLADVAKARALVTRRYGAPHLCLAVPLGAWRRFVAGDRSALARALAIKQALLDPAPTWAHALIGAAAVSDAANRSARLAGKLLSRSPLGSLLGGAPEKLAGKLTNPLEALGVDPWELMRVGRSWTRRALPLIIDRG
ncbi:MAG: hypothetical protein CSA65_00895 [Proteobacteria bacterium]|nr:MAG: hypothetical protein CSA65_00895 [Pseudomonadota bacterium]